MQLKWVGDPRYVTGVAGWPASDHDESDKRVAREKIKSGLYAGPTSAEREQARRDAITQKRAANAKAKRHSDERIATAEQDVETAQGALTNTRRREGRES